MSFLLASPAKSKAASTMNDRLSNAVRLSGGNDGQVAAAWIRAPATVAAITSDKRLDEERFVALERRRCKQSLPEFNGDGHAALGCHTASKEAVGAVAELGCQVTSPAVDAIGVITLKTEALVVLRPAVAHGTESLTGMVSLFARRGFSQSKRWNSRRAQDWRLRAVAVTFNWLEKDRLYWFHLIDQGY